MRHIDAISQGECFFCGIHKVKEAQLADDWRKVVRSLFETKGHEDYYIINQIVFKDPGRDLIVIPYKMETMISDCLWARPFFGEEDT